MAPTRTSGLAQKAFDYGSPELRGPNRFAEIERSLSRRLMAPIRELDRLLRDFGASRTGVRLSAALRHPRNPRKRKIYREKHMPGPNRHTWERREGKPRDLPTYLRIRYSEHDLRAVMLGMEYIERFGKQGPLSSHHVASDADLRNLVDRVSTLARSTPIVDVPTVSIIVPVFNQLVYTLACLSSVLSQRVECTYEMIIADDASHDGTESALKEVGGCVRYIRNERNLGFLRSCNFAANSARGQYLLFLNNDTQVLPGAIDHLVGLARARSDAGLVGSKLIFPDGRLQEAGGIIWRDASAWNYGRNNDPGKREYNYVRDVDYISGAAILIPRILWSELGGFDERYAPAYCEDSDLALRIHSRGLKVLYQPLSEVVHHEGISHGTSPGSSGKAYQVQNLGRLRERWGETLERSHFPNATRVMRAKDRAFARPILLIIDHYIPEPDRDAGSCTMLEFMRTFLELGFVVKFLPQNGRYNDEHGPILEQMGVEVLCELSRRQFYEWLEINGAEIDFVLLSRPTVAPDYIAAFRRLTKAHLAYYGHDLHFLRMQREAEVTRDRERDRTAIAMAQTERAIWRGVDTVLYPSQEEVDTVRSLEIVADTRLVPPYCFDNVTVRKQPPSSHSIVFVAGFGHTPNIDAAIWFVEQVLPIVRSRQPGVKLSLIGSKPNEQVMALAAGDLEVTGYVSSDELARRYAAARVAVVPLRFGAGIKLKIVEAMRHGVPVVTTPVGAQGLPGIGDIVPVCSEATAFAEAVLDLLANETAWAQQSSAGADYVNRFFSPRAMRAALAEAFPIRHGATASR